MNELLHITVFVCTIHSAILSYFNTTAFHQCVHSTPQHFISVFIPTSLYTRLPLQPPKVDLAVDLVRLYNFCKALVNEAKLT